MMIYLQQAEAEDRISSTKGPASFRSGLQPDFAHRKRDRVFRNWGSPSGGQIRDTTEYGHAQRRCGRPQHGGRRATRTHEHFPLLNRHLHEDQEEQQ